MSNTDIHYDLINCDENATYFSTPDGLEDYAGCTDDMDVTDPANPVQKTNSGGYLQHTGTAYDAWKGWTCFNLPVTDTGTEAWQLSS